MLSIENLTVRFATQDGEVAAVSDVSLKVAKGECLGIVGESGSGKSQTFMAALGLLATNGQASGRVDFSGTDLIGASEDTLNTIRGNKISMIFQDVAYAAHESRSAVGGGAAPASRPVRR